MDLNIRDDAFRRAVRVIERRAERHIYEENLTKSFVPNRVLEELDTTANQLLFGRRGVGKTHTLKVFLSEQVQHGHLTHYVDCTAFGSGLGADGSNKNVGVRFFRTFLITLADELLEDARLRERRTPDTETFALDVLANIAQCADPKHEGETFDYLGIINFLNQFLDLLNAERITILIDEWAQIPRDAQPYFGEFLKRAFFSNPRVTVKIGVVDFTHRLDSEIDGSKIGLERSADVFSDIYMDRFFVWDQDQEFVESFFAEVIYNHLALELKLQLNCAAEEKNELVLNRLFTQRRVFSEMCRAAEGNARDLLVLFGKAHARFRQQTTHQKVGLDEVQSAAIELYRGDKYSNISTERHLEDFLDDLINDVIKDKRSRTFMVPYQNRQHPILARLYSARILHLLDVEWSHPHKPGERYSLVTMDYGTYAAFRGTQNEPVQNLFWPVDATCPEELDIVPLDDRRSIRRIILEEGKMDEYWAKRRPE